MPTGYTAKIKDGIEFDEFIMGCARAFGACITMRDDSSDSEIPDEFKPSPYHAEKIQESNGKLDELLRFTADQLNCKAEDDYKDSMASHNKSIQDANDLLAKYSDMLGCVHAWIPPSKDHEGLKSFMEEQLKSSIKFDCGTDYYKENEPVKLSPLEWFEKKRDSVNYDIDYHTKQHKEEVERCSDRTKWVTDLRTSL